MELERTGQTQSRQAEELKLAPGGKGPLLQRDYWAVIRECRLSPSQVGRALALHFERFAPEELVVFRRERSAPLEVGDELKVKIVGAGTFGVRVIHQDAQALTIGTIKGHPEAGRITFGAYRNVRGDVVFHIRSRARSASRLHYFGFLGPGEPMQTNCWTEFVNRVAEYAGRGVVGFIHAHSERCEDTPDESATDAPTFEARGD